MKKKKREVEEQSTQKYTPCHFLYVIFLLLFLVHQREYILDFLYLYGVAQTHVHKHTPANK